MLFMIIADGKGFCKKIKKSHNGNTPLAPESYPLYCTSFLRIKETSVGYTPTEYAIKRLPAP